MNAIISFAKANSYVLLLIATVAIAALLPVYGVAAKVVSQVSYGAVALLFFLYGAKLKSETIIAGITNLRLQSLVVGSTFVLFPLLGLAIVLVAGRFIPSELSTGFLFLTLLPSTVQSSIALTAMARGNVPAAICAASLSNVLGVVVTPVLAALLLNTNGLRVDASTIIWICLQLLAPFLAGQLLRPWIGARVERAKRLTTIVDRGSILLIVYSAFSAGMVAGIWSKLSLTHLGVVVAMDMTLLVTVVGLMLLVGRRLKLDHADSMALLFCGSQKSLASGVPMANILFAGSATATTILPLMLFHQFQLILAAAIAQRMANRFRDAEVLIPKTP
ncbi:MAG: bile acid:sodium symporter family protein [Devosia sp.]